MISYLLNVTIIRQEILTLHDTPSLKLPPLTYYIYMYSIVRNFEDFRFKLKVFRID